MADSIAPLPSSSGERLPDYMEFIKGERLQRETQQDKEIQANIPMEQREDGGIDEVPVFYPGGQPEKQPEKETGPKKARATKTEKSTKTDLATPEQIELLRQENDLLREKLALLRDIAEFEKKTGQVDQGKLDSKENPLNARIIVDPQKKNDDKFNQSQDQPKGGVLGSVPPGGMPPIDNAGLPEKGPVSPEKISGGRERNYKTAALIAGVVVGGAGGILGGAPVAATGAFVCIGAGLLNKGLDYVGGRRITTLEKQLETATGTERESLERRISNWKKIRTGSEYATQFITGATIGFAASGIASIIFNGGHGLIWNKPDIPPLTPPTGPEVPPTGPEVPPTTPPGTGPELPYEGNSLIHDGRVDLPGSAWDGNLAGGPGQDTLAGGAENFSNFDGGQTEMAAHQLGEDLASSNVTDQLLGNLSTYEKHKLLTEYWNTIRGGNPNPELIPILKGMGTEGAQKLLAALGL